MDISYTGTWTRNTRVHIYFNYKHFNTVFIKTRRFVFLNTTEIETPINPPSPYNDSLRRLPI